MGFKGTVKRLIAPALALAALGMTQGALADGNTERGAVLADTCKGCHAIENYKNVYPTYFVPKLGGQNAAYVVEALKGYKTEQRGHPTMRSQAADMTDEDMQDIAAYFASYGEPKTGDTVGNAPQAATVCVSCHGEAGISIVELYPNLAGQHQDYLEVTLTRYKSGERQNAVMAAFAATLSPDQIKELAEFYASQSGLYTISD